MFYEPDKDDHGLPFNPYKSIVVPRPIGWISTITSDGIVNLAPYSQFNNLGYDPPYVMFSANSFPETGRRKDSVKNAMPIELRDRIAADIRAAAADPALIERLAAVGQVARGGTPAEFSAMIDEQHAKMASIVKSLGLKPQR